MTNESTERFLSVIQSINRACDLLNGSEHQDVKFVFTMSEVYYMEHERLYVRYAEIRADGVVILRDNVSSKDKDSEVFTETISQRLIASIMMHGIMAMKQQTDSLIKYRK